MIAALPIALCVSAALPSELTDLSAKMRAITSLQVSMRQQKEMKVFGELLESRGHLIFARPRRLRMDLVGEGGSTVVIDGSRMQVHYKALAKTETFDIAKDPRAKAVAEHLFLLLDADPAALVEIYSIEILGKEPLHVRLIPKAPALKRILANVEARFDPRGFVDRLVLNESNGDATRWFFEKPVFDATVDAKQFALAP